MDSSYSYYSYTISLYPAEPPPAVKKPPITQPPTGSAVDHTAKEVAKEALQVLSLSQRNQPHPPSLAVKQQLLNAIRNRNLDKIKQLIKEENFDLDAILELQDSALDLAIQFESVDMVLLFIASGAKIDEKRALGILLLGKAKGREELVKKAIDSQDLNSKNQKFKNVALLAAAQLGLEDIAEMLINKGADINYKSFTEETALLLAAKHGHKKIVAMIIDKRANINDKDDYFITALMAAALNGHKEIVEMLVNAGAKLNLQAEDGYTALMNAAQNGHKEIVEMLIKKGAELNVKDNRRNTALMHAALNGHKEIVMMLIKAGAELNFKDNRGNTALMYAAEIGREEIVMMLIKAGAELNFKDNREKTALMKAALNGYKEIVKMLVNAGADINDKDAISNNIFLLAAAELGRKDIVEKFIEAGAKLNHPDHLGHTALMLAAQNNHDEIVNLLIQHGANSKELIALAVGGICGVTGKVQINGQEISLDDGMARGLGIFYIKKYLKEYLASGLSSLKPENAALILDAFNNSFDITSSLSPNPSEILSRINDKKPAIIAGGTKTHNVAIVIYNGKIAICNRGSGCLEKGSGVRFYQPKEITLDLIQKLITEYSDMTEFNKIVVPALGDEIEGDRINLKLQKKGNCVTASDKAAVYALAYMLEKENSESFYKDFTTFMRLSCYATCKEELPELAKRFETEKLAKKFDPKHRSYKHFLAQLKPDMQNLFPNNALIQAAESGTAADVQRVIAVGANVDAQKKK